MKKITFIAPGNSIHSKRWIDFFNNQKYKIQWISFHEFNDTNLLINQIYIINKFYNLLLNNLKVLYYVNQFKTDIIHIHSVSLYLFASLILFFKKKKIIITLWGSDVNNANKFKKILIKFFIKRAFAVTTDSHQFYNDFLKFHTNKKLINFGIDTSFFKPNTKAIENLIICPRGFDDIYRPYVILNAINMVKSKIKNLKFVLIGSKNKKEEILKFIDSKKLNNIITVSDTLDQKSYLNLVNKSIGMISSSLSDAGIASSIAEFMSCNKIIIATNNSDNHYWIKDQINGYLFENDDTKKLSKILLFVDKNIDKIKFQNRDLIIEKNDYTNEMKKVDKIYSQA